MTASDTTATSHTASTAQIASPAAQTAELIGALTLEEKASLTLGADFWRTAAVERLGINAIMVSDGPHGLRAQSQGSDHVGLAASAPATCFPPAATLGSSWDPELASEVGAAIGREAQALGVGVVLGPGMNIKRSPLCGRNFEYLSEDPYLTGRMAAGLVDGLQGEGVGASVKHFAVNNQETDRLRVSADVDERTLREIYLPAFEYVVTRSRPWTVMCAYNRVNGEFASQHRWLLTTVLRQEWGFDGLVVSDWGAVDSRVPSLAAGLDLEMPPNLGVSDAEVVAAVRSGALAESDLDTAAGRVLQLVARVEAGRAAGGKASAGKADAGPGPAVDVDGHHALARRAARESAVLLKNQDGILPLELSPSSRIAVIGEFARTPRYQGAGSSQVSPTRLDTALDALTAAVPAGVGVGFAAGFGVDTADDDDALAREAVELATGADVVLLFLGLPASAESEGFDRTHLRLPASQRALVAALAAVNPRIVTVLSNGSAVQLSDWVAATPALLECWLGGQAGGGAVVDLLLGAADPSGRLAETLPVRLEDVPSYLNFPGDSGHVRYGEGIFVGYRGFDAADTVVSYPFGHGLSYTTFDYSDLAVAVTGSHDAGTLALTVACTVTNTGRRAGRDVVQVYVGDVVCSVARPVRELKGFAKVDLQPGESTRVEVELDSRALAYWSITAHDWVVEAGEFDISVGASSRDLRLTTRVSIEAASTTPPLTTASTLQEWLADPRGGPALRAAFGVDAQGRPAGILADPQIIEVIGNFPMIRLSAFAGMGLGRDTLDALVRDLDQ